MKLGRFSPWQQNNQFYNLYFHKPVFHDNCQHFSPPFRIDPCTHLLASHNFRNCIESILLTAFPCKHRQPVPGWWTSHAKKRIFTGEFPERQAWDYIFESLYFQLFILFRSFLFLLLPQSLPCLARLLCTATPRITSRSRVPVYSPSTFNKGFSTLVKATL